MIITSLAGGAATRPSAERSGALSGLIARLVAWWDERRRIARTVAELDQLSDALENETRLRARAQANCQPHPGPPAHAPAGARCPLDYREFEAIPSPPVRSQVSHLWMDICATPTMRATCRIGVPRLRRASAWKRLAMWVLGVLL